MPAYVYPFSYSCSSSATRFLQQFSALLGAEKFFGGVAPGYGELSLWLLVEDKIACWSSLMCLILSLPASSSGVREDYRRITDFTELVAFFASRPQVGEGTYGMPGSKQLVQWYPAPQIVGRIGVCSASTQAEIDSRD